MLTRIKPWVTVSDRRLLVRFLLVFTFISCLLTAGLFLFYRQEMRLVVERLRYQEVSDLKLKSETMTTELNAVISDMRLLRELPALMMYLAMGSEALRAEVASAYFLFCLHRGFYDQIRYLDETGMEIVRINFNNGRPAIVKVKNLQPKGDSYYFTDTKKLNRHDIYVSRFDLNIENKAIEIPYKPMLRFSTPVFDRSGRKRGVVVLNYRGEILLDILRRVSLSSKGIPMLLDIDGYWLYNPANPKSEWAFMYPERRNLRFSLFYPAAWDTIVKNRTGQIETPAGVFTYDTLSAVQPSSAVLTDSTKAYETGGNNLDKAPLWKILSFLPSARLRWESQKILRMIKPFAATLVIMTALTSWLMAKIILDHRLERERLTYRALHDPLTELPNRILLMDRLNQAILKAKRNDYAFALFFIDLDEFKLVNDRFGHQAGDQVLKKVAARIVGALRTSDTVARRGGDEFCALVHGINSAKDAAMIADKLILAITEQIDIDGGTAHVGASIGISICPIIGRDADLLLATADQAMYQAKSMAGNGYIIAT